MNLESALQTFIAESRELLQDMETALLRLEHDPADTSVINAIFRAAHTIKGSAGLFGLDAIVAFTHVVESVLDKVRDAEVDIDSELASLLLSCCDHLCALVEVVANGNDGSVTVDGGAPLIERLKRYLDAAARQAVAAVETSASNVNGPLAESDNWHISLRFGHDVLRNGMDPLSFLRYLKTLGDIVAISTLADAIPPGDAMDPESCYLGFEIALRSSADKLTIENVFEFVRDDARIHILPPNSRVAEYIDLIRALPDEEMKLGEILVKCGTLTENELREGLAAQNRSTTAGPIGSILVDSGDVRPTVVEAALHKQQQVKDAYTKQQKSIRIDADKLDQLINLIGELVISAAGAQMVARRLDVGEMVEATTEVGTFIEQVRDSVLSLRMVQIGETFNRFQRVVRDVSRELGKEINLEVAGSETELDKAVVEKIGDPLTHLVRNAMDHGIESVETRLARGKPANGTLRLNAYHESGSIIIEVSDDGGGLNREKILSKAVERGLVAEGAQLADREIYQLIFLPGFSTTDQISNLSGRGVGMDVVQRNIEALRGTIDLDTTPGQGSTVRIRLPLTLAIIDGFMVGVGKATYVIPLDMVIECIECAAWQDGDNGGHCLNLRGEILPYLRLRDLFEISGAAARRENIVVVQHGGRKAGLVVDTLLGEFQTVIKPLGQIFGRAPGIAGSTILGNGEVALILDVPGLIKQDSRPHTRLPGTVTA